MRLHRLGLWIACSEEEQSEWVSQRAEANEQISPKVESVDCSEVDKFLVIEEGNIGLSLLPDTTQK